MHRQTIREIVDELNMALAGGVLGKVFQVSSASFAIDFRRREGGYLFVSADPSLPRIHLIARRTREMEQLSRPLNEFAQAMRANLAGSKLTGIKQDESERVVRFSLLRQEETGEIQERNFVAQLTGRSANLFLLDAQGRITHAQRFLNGTGQQVGELYAPPAAHHESTNVEPRLQAGPFRSLSAAADDHYQRLEATRRFDAQAGTARARLRQEIARLQKLQKHLRGDLRAHGEAEQHKRMGDLLLANIGNAERRGNTVQVKDFYAPGIPTVEIEVDEKTSLQAEAAKYFGRYSKAKRAVAQIAKRLGEIDVKLGDLERQTVSLESIVAERDEAGLAQLTHEQNPQKKTPAGPKTRAPEKVPGTRRYLSSDGYEVLVGRASKDNDHLTFRIARAQDLWLHAADYPGSHVIVRNPSRKDVPHRTLIEAAQLAAKFSQASNDTKVNVNYTQQKFVSRIKGAAPGLVRLASFRTIMVEPKESIERI